MFVRFIEIEIKTTSIDQQSVSSTLYWINFVTRFLPFDYCILYNHGEKEILSPIFYTVQPSEDIDLHVSQKTLLSKDKLLLTIFCYAIKQHVALLNFHINDSGNEFIKQWVLFLFWYIDTKVNAIWWYEHYLYIVRYNLNYIH